MKKNITKMVYPNVTIDVVSEGKHRVQFTADRFELKHVVDTNEADVLFANEFQAEIQAVRPDSVCVNLSLNEVQRPKYCAAMGDAAQEYVDVTVFDKFRWEEVWNRMWAVREPQQAASDKTGLTKEKLNKFIMEFVNSTEHGTYYNTGIALSAWMNGPGKESVDRLIEDSKVYR